MHRQKTTDKSAISLSLCLPKATRDSLKFVSDPTGPTASIRVTVIARLGLHLAAMLPREATDICIPREGKR